ncbi:MAG: hypothetical protein M1813_000422 [Trichoglossum hirsutum]|jgi:hypothetical protein|nr:MAG: hypothetical protein M1813_000422 [Trichoglossum hirsutum]
MSVPERPSLSRASSTGLSRVLSRRRQLSDPRQWSPEPVAQPRVNMPEEVPAGVEVRGDRQFRFGFWVTVILLQLSVISTSISVVYLVQDARGNGAQAFHLIWVVLSGTLCIVLSGTTWIFLQRRRELRRRAQETVIARLSADVDALVQHNIELQISSRRSRDHGSTSGRRASPLGEEDFASYHRFQERGMDRQVKAWLEQMAAFDGLFEDARGGSIADASDGPVQTPAVHNTTVPLRMTHTA